jgi:nicotinate dehydrogenase subunit B
MNLAFRLAQGGAARPDLPASLSVNPDRSIWLSWCADGTVEVRSGKVEIGQGILTALAQIAAQSLCLPISRIRMIAASTARSPDEAVTSGSLSVQESGAAIRIVCNELRERLIERAAQAWGLPSSECEASEGKVRDRSGSRELDYADLAPAELLEGEVGSDAPARALASNAALEGKGPVGQPVPRFDLPAKLRGKPVYVHDLVLPGMLHARVVRSSLPGARLEKVDGSVLKKLGDRVKLWRDGDFVAVTSEREWLSVKAAATLEGALGWALPELPFDDQSVNQWLCEQPADSKVIASRAAESAPSSPPTLDEVYAKPFIAHASIMPSCALARWDGNRLEVWSHSQGIFNLRADLALVFPDAQITVYHVEGAGCYGHNGADDVALDAALVAQMCMAPVRLLWSRRDELTRSPFGSAMTMRCRAWMSSGRIARWEHEVWSGGHSLRPGRAHTPTLLAATEIASNRFEPRESVNAALAAGGGSERNAIPAYSFAELEVTNHRIRSMPLRTSALRSLGAFGNVFAIESSMDDLARLAGIDPIEFRLAHLEHPRARRVLEILRSRISEPDAVASPHAVIAGPRPQPRHIPRSGLSAPDGDAGTGLGIGFAHYKNTGAWCAVSAEISVTDRISVERITVIADLGCVINPDGARNQLEGGALQACSWALLESMPIDRRLGPLATDWSSYPILSFTEQPELDVVLVDARSEAPLGAGECAHGPTVAAIANALCDAVGLRIRELPLTKERLREAALG